MGMMIDTDTCRLCTGPTLYCTEFFMHINDPNFFGGHFASKNTTCGRICDACYGLIDLRPHVKARMDGYEPWSISFPATPISLHCREVQQLILEKLLPSHVFTIDKESFTGKGDHSFQIKKKLCGVEADHLIQMHQNQV